MMLKSLAAILLLAPFSGLHARPEDAGTAHPQPELQSRGLPLLHQDGLTFKDLNRDGRLESFEDWRLPAQVRAADLLSRMTLEEQAGLMVHGTLPSTGPMAAVGTGQSYDLAKVQHFVHTDHVSTFITRLHAPAATFAHQNNEVQALAEKERWGIPVTISSDPRHHFEKVLGASEEDSSFSLWPEPLGLAAIGDPGLTRRFADVVRQEYLAVGLRESLAPQADIVTEPRWARSNGTFGADSHVAAAMVGAYVAGIQNGTAGLNEGSVAAIVKHWAGYGAQKDGWDSHNFYGRYATFPGHNFSEHLFPFTGAFKAGVAGVMPTYSILQGISVDGKPLEQVGANFNKQLLDLLRGQYAFRGVVVSDWAITNDCTPRCQNGAPAGEAPSPADIATPWGVMDLTREQRFAKTINAGVDQIGGTEDSSLLVKAVQDRLLTEDRVREAALRILVQKFQMGLFENPFADETAAGSVAGRSDFVEEGRQAQAAACVLLKNRQEKVGSAVLPLAPSGTKVWLFGIAPEEATKRGMVVVQNPADADVALIHAPAPWQSEHPNYFFGSRQHEGRLAFTAVDPAFKALVDASTHVPVVFVTTLERPLILTNVLPHAAALVGDFGIEDGTLLDLLQGTRQARGHLPFNLPRSATAVAQQKSDVPDDDLNPLFRRGYAMKWKR